MKLHNKQFSIEHKQTTYVSVGNIQIYQAESEVHFTNVARSPISCLQNDF